MRWIEATDGSAREVLGAFLKSFVPVDEESRLATLMYIALYTERTIAMLEGGSDVVARSTEVELMHATILEQLQRGPLQDAVDPEAEATMLTALAPGLGQYVLDGTMTAHQVYATVDQQLDRLFAQ